MEDRKEAGLLMDVFGEFAVNCQKKGVAHLVIVSSEASAVQTIAKYFYLVSIFSSLFLPPPLSYSFFRILAYNGGSKTKVFILSDVPDHSALEYLRTSLIPLQIRPDEEEIKHAVSKLGGRVADLESFSQKVLTGGKPREVLHRMIGRTVGRIRADGFGYSPGKPTKHSTSTNARKWTPVQLWKVIRKLAEEDVVYYDDIVANIFGGNVEAFNSLVQLNIFSVRQTRVTAYSRLYRSAFMAMVEDKHISIPMDRQVIFESLESSKTKLREVLDELVKIKTVQPFMASFRKTFNFFPTATIVREKMLEEQLTSVTERIVSLNAQLGQLTSQILYLVCWPFYVLSLSIFYFLIF